MIVGFLEVNNELKTTAIGPYADEILNDLKELRRNLSASTLEGKAWRLVISICPVVEVGLASEGIFAK